MEAIKPPVAAPAAHQKAVRALKTLDEAEALPSDNEKNQKLVSADTDAALKAEEAEKKSQAKQEAKAQREAEKAAERAFKHADKDPAKEAEKEAKFTAEEVEAVQKDEASKRKIKKIAHQEK